MNVAIYARVSTSDQSVDMQVTELTSYAARMGWTIGERYIDSGFSGAKDSRPALDKLLTDARLKRFDAVLVWKLDRFGRSLAQLVRNVQSLDEYGVRFVSLTEGIDTNNASPTGRLLLHMFAAFAEFERALIKERVTAGIKEAKRKGVHTGRPKRVFHRDEAVRLHGLGHSYREIAKMLGVPVMTVSDAVRKPLPQSAPTEAGNKELVTV